MIEYFALNGCYCLRNVAFLPDAVFGNNVIIGRNHIDNGAISDPFHLFGNSDETIVESATSI
jgi:hypothetical protein